MAGGDTTTNLIIIGAILAGGAFIFMNRCQYLGMCDDGPMAPMPEPATPIAQVPIADVGDGEQDPRTTIINNQYYPLQPQNPIVIRDRRYVPVPVPPYPSKPKPSACPTRISRNGVSYTLTTLTEMPIQTAIFPPTFIQENHCIYRQAQGPTPQPKVKTNKCCKCIQDSKNEPVRCSHDGGKTWSESSRYRY